MYIAIYAKGLFRDAQNVYAIKIVGTVLKSLSTKELSQFQASFHIETKLIDTF